MPQELQYARELAEWDARVAGRTDELLALTRENTACLNAVSELTSAQRALEGGLTATRKGLFTDPVQQRKAEVREAGRRRRRRRRMGGARRMDGQDGEGRAPLAGGRAGERAGGRAGGRSAKAGCSKSA